METFTIKIYTCLKILKEAEQGTWFAFLLNIYKTKHIKSWCAY